MPVVTVRGLPEEIPTIPEAAVRPRTRVRIGAELAAFGAAFGGLDLDLARSPDPAEPPPSWPGQARPSAHERSGVDGRIRPGHDGRASDPRMERT